MILTKTTFPVIYPNWPAPKHIKAFTSTRKGGISNAAPYHYLNVADDVGDAPEHVIKNRQLLYELFDFPTEPAWLKQVHGNEVINLNTATEFVANASFTVHPHQVCVVKTADCLPLLITNKKGTLVAAVHVGWRGLVQNIIEKTIAQLSESATELLIWLGPAIGPRVFEVGEDVYEACAAQDTQAPRAFIPTGTPKKWHANLYTLARNRLHQHGIPNIYGGDRCTYTEKDYFFSYRRDKTTGRMGSFIWIDNI